MSKPKYIYFLLLLLYLIQSSECDKNKSDDRPLYDNSTAILSVSPSNVKQLIYDQPYAVLLFLYQNWCEECIKQIDVNLQLEKELAYWQPIFKFAMINYDSQAGRDFNVSGSFEYRLVKPNTLSLRHVARVELNGLNTKENIIGSSLAALLELNKTNEELKELKWPKLNPLEPFDLQQTDLFTDRTLIFVNKDNSFEERRISTEVTLDFANYTDQLDILNCNESVFAASEHTKQHINYPALYQFVESNKTVSLQLLGQGLTRLEFRNLTIEKFLADKWNPIDIQTKPKIKNQNEDRPQKKVANVFPVYYRDLNNALRKVFFSDLVRFKVFSPEQVEIMTNLTAVFREYYPYDNENARRFLKRVALWMKERNQTEPLKVEKFRATIKAGAEGFLQTEQPFISCRGSQPHLRGYPCSIWLLMHSLTVQEYLKLTNKTLTKNNNTTLPDHSVLRSMRGYMKYFFPCTNCAKNFEQDSIDLESRLVDANSSILWLWEAHNRFNLRLRNKTNDDPEYPKQVFPNYEACKTCYLQEPAASLESPEDLASLQWNKTEVVSFLINQYRKESLLKSAAILSNLSGGYLVLAVWTLLAALITHRTF